MLLACQHNLASGQSPPSWALDVPDLVPGTSETTQPSYLFGATDADWLGDRDSIFFSRIDANTAQIDWFRGEPDEALRLSIIEDAVANGLDPYQVFLQGTSIITDVRLFPFQSPDFPGLSGACASYSIGNDQGAIFAYVKFTNVSYDGFTAEELGDLPDALPGGLQSTQLIPMLYVDSIDGACALAQEVAKLYVPEGKGGRYVKDQGIWNIVPTDAGPATGAGSAAACFQAYLFCKNQARIRKMAGHATCKAQYPILSLTAVLAGATCCGAAGAYTGNPAACIAFGVWCAAVAIDEAYGQRANCQRAVALNFYADLLVCEHASTACCQDAGCGS